MTVRGFGSRRWSLNVQQHHEPVWTMLPEPDPTWEYVDLAGHRHDASKDLLREVTRPAYSEIDNNEYDSHHHWECVECGEWIVPGTRMSLGPTYVNGFTEATITGGIDGDFWVTVRFENPDEIEDLWRRVIMTTTPEIRDRIIEKWVEEHPQYIVSKQWGMY